MKPGKITETMRKRTVQKQLKNRHQGIFPDLSAERVCYGISMNGKDVMIAEASRYGNQKDLGYFALMAAVNDLAAAGAQPEAVMVRIFLTEYAYESRLKSMVEAIEAAAACADVQVMDAAAEVVPVMRSSMVHVTAVGSMASTGSAADAACPKEQVPPEKMPPGMAAGAGRRAEMAEGIRYGQNARDLVLTKWAGMEGTLRILEERREELSGRFVPAFLNQTAALRAYLPSIEEIRIARNMGVAAMRQVSEEGILAALWKLAESLEAGLTVSLKAIPVRQETIEICEYYHVNPYEMTSAGCILMAAEDGHELVKAMEERKIPAAVIGRLEEGNDRIIMRGDEISYLERPQAEALAGCFAVWNKEEV